MGFLLGAYGKLAAGSRYRSLQARMMRIQSKIRRATRDVANMEKMLDRNMKRDLQSLTLNANATKGLYQQIMYGAMTPEVLAAQQALSQFQANPKDKDGNPTLSNEQIAAYSQQVSSWQSTMNQQLSTASTNLDQGVAYQKEQIENYYEQMRDQLLEPLKDEEDSLQLEKDTLESQIQVAKADYEACQKMEQADVKMLTPNYTGGQG